MNRVLVSIPGFTDPIKNGREGPILHSFRMNTPNVAYIIKSEDISKEWENRYQRAIDVYASFYDINIVYKYVDGDIHKYDQCLPKIESILEEIKKEQPEDSEYTFNLSSGTPQAVSSFLVLADVVFGVNVKFVQIHNPNKNGHKLSDVLNYSVNDSIIQDCFDLEESLKEDRCEFVDLYNLKKMESKKQLVEALYVYDYDKAIYIAEYILKENKLANNLKAFNLRKQLRTSEALLRGVNNFTLSKKLGNSLTSADMVLENIYILDMNKKDILSFSKSFGTVNETILRLLALKFVNFDVLLHWDDRIRKFIVEERYLKDLEIKGVFSKSPGFKGRKYQYKNSYEISKKIVVELKQLSCKVKKSVKLLVKFQDIRNKFVHEIDPYVALNNSQKLNKKDIAVNSEMIMEVFDSLLVVYAEISGTKEYSNIYDEMNRELIKKYGLTHV